MFTWQQCTKHGRVFPLCLSNGVKTIPVHTDPLNEILYTKPNTHEVTIFKTNSCFCSLHRDDNGIVLKHVFRPIWKWCRVKGPGHSEMPELKSVVKMIWFNSLPERSQAVAFPNIRHPNSRENTRLPCLQQLTSLLLWRNKRWICSLEHMGWKVFYAIFQI